MFGAEVALPSVIHGPLVVHGASTNYSHLRLGSNVHVGRLAFLDLTGALTIEADATVSMGATILTHADVGGRPLSSEYPRHVSETRVGNGSYIGANATVLAGCHVGRRAVVGAGAVVTQQVPDEAVVGGVPARELRERTG